MVLSRLLLSVALCLPWLAYGQAYKCIVNGALVFQQEPCTGGTKLDVHPPPDPNSRDGRIALAVAKKQVFIGMSEEEVVRSWGKPNKINRSGTARSIHEQWIYERGEIGNNQYLYIEDGVLRSVQSPK